MTESNNQKVINISDDALVLVVGPSSSGKTTFVSNWFPEYVVIHSDEFRLRTCNDANDMSATGDAFDVMSFLAEKRISRGLLTVIDAMNVTKEFREYFVKHARKYNRPIYALIIATPLAVCESRHGERTERPWNVEILRDQYNSFMQSIIDLQNDENITVEKVDFQNSIEIVLTKGVDLKATTSIKKEKWHKTERATSAIILNAGKGVKWGNYLGIPKQLIQIGGETLLNRTVRMLRQLGIDNITSVTNDTRLVASGSRQYKPELNRWTVETLLSTSDLWTDQNLIILGDVFFTPTAMQAICMSNNEIQFLGRCSKNRFNGHRTGEIFALKFNIEKKHVIQEAALKVIDQCDSIAWGNLWDLYYTLIGLPIRTYDKVEDKFFLEVHDFTDDFDKPEDYLNSIDTYEKYVRLERGFNKLNIYNI